MREIQEITKKMPKSWNIFDHPDGHLLSLYDYTSKGIIDTACCGAFKRKSAEEAKQLIEDLAKCNYKAPSETSGSSSRLKGSGVVRAEQTDCHRSKT